MTPGILFLCVANSARSQMAEGLTRRLFGDQVTVQSAGSAPAGVNPAAVAVMAELGIDLGGHRSKAVRDIDPDSVSVAVVLCDEEVCPPSFGAARVLHWPIADPAGETRSDQERLERFRGARDQLRAMLLARRDELLPDAELRALEA